MTAGRPTKYKPEYCQELIDFFSIPRTREIEVTHKNTKGESWTKTEEKPNPLPQFIDFSMKIGVCDDTLTEWKKTHEEFSAAYNKAKALQKSFLIENGLAGHYNAPFAIFTAKNITDMRDKQEMEHSGEIKGVVVLPAEKIPGDE